MSLSGWQVYRSFCTCLLRSKNHLCHSNTDSKTSEACCEFLLLAAFFMLWNACQRNCCTWELHFEGLDGAPGTVACTFHNKHEFDSWIVWYLKRVCCVWMIRGCAVKRHMCIWKLLSWMWLICRSWYWWIMQVVCGHLSTIHHGMAWHLLTLWCLSFCSLLELHWHLHIG